MDGQKKLISIKEASQLLGVTPLTLRNWDKKGKLCPLRHPINNYRVYRREDIDKLIANINESTTSTRSYTSKKNPKKLQVKHLDEYGDN